MGGVCCKVEAMSEVIEWGLAGIRNQRLTPIMPMTKTLKKFHPGQFDLFCRPDGGDYKLLVMLGDHEIWEDITDFMDSIANRVLRDLDLKDLLTMRQVSKVWNMKATPWLRLRGWTKLDSEEKVVAFLKVFQALKTKNGSPFGQFALDLWKIKGETIYDFSCSLGSGMTGLSLTALGPNAAHLEAFLQRDVHAKIAVLLHKASNLTFLSVQTDYEIEIAGFLHLILPPTFPSLGRLVIKFSHSELNHRNHLLSTILTRAPALRSLDIALPEENGDEILEKVVSLLQNRKFGQLSLSIWISYLSLQALNQLMRSGIDFTALELHIVNSYEEDLQEALHGWLASQSHCLERLKLNTNFPVRSTVRAWRLPVLRKMEMLSILVNGRAEVEGMEGAPPAIPPIQPFEPTQFPGMTTFAFVHSGAGLSLFDAGIFSKITTIGFSGMNGNFPNLMSHLPNLEHITLCGVKIPHVETILTQMTSIVEMVLLFTRPEDRKLDLWDTLTCRAVRFWDQLFDSIFNNSEEGMDVSWELLERANDIAEPEPNASIFETLFSNSLDILNSGSGTLINNLLETFLPSPSKEEKKSQTPSLENMKNLEFLKLVGTNASNFLAIVYMTLHRKLRSLKCLTIEVIPGFDPLPEHVEILRSHHNDVIVKTEVDII